MSYSLPQNPTFFASYGSYEFPSLAETVGLALTPYKTGDGRATKYTEWMIRLQFDIQADANGTTDAEALLALAQLNHTGENFIYRGRGLGNPQINTSGVTDLKWGPHGKVEGIEVRAASKCLRVTWSVSFCIPTCPEKWFDNNLPFLEIVYGVTITPDDAGFVTKTCQGYATIANNRTSPGAITALRSPDDYRVALTIPCMEMFHRRFKPWVISEDRTRLDFGWDDTEMPVVLPEHVVECHMSDSLQSTKEGLATWQGTITANYRLRRGASGLIAALHFLQQVKTIIEERKAEILAIGPGPASSATFGGLLRDLGVATLIGPLLAPFYLIGRLNSISSPPPETLRSVPVPLSFSASNPDRYGKPAASFSFGYTFAVPIANLFQVCDLWNPVEAGKWSDWYGSLATSAMHPYAGAGVRFSIGDDNIFDPCYPQGRGGSTKELRGEPPATVKTSIRELFPKPEKDSSWLIYKNDIFVESDTGTVELKTIPSEEPDPEDEAFGSESELVGTNEDFIGLMESINNLQGPTLVIENESTERNGLTGGRLDSEVGTPSTGSFRRSAPSCVAFLRGYAARVGYPIPCPILKEVGGMVATPASRPDRGEGFSTGTHANVVHTIHIASWNLRFLLPGVPDGPILPPKNPILGN